MKTMTNRERMTALIQGRPIDRVPFVQYDGLLPTQELWTELGRENVGLFRWIWPCCKIEHPNCRVEARPIGHDGLKGERRTLITPKGSLTSEVLFDPAYHSAAHREHYVKELRDYDVLDAYFDDAVVTDDLDTYRQIAKELGDDGLPMPACPRNSWQQLWVQWVDITDLSAHFADDEDRLMATIAKMDRIMRKTFDCLCRMRPVFASFPDNITASMIGRDKFERFCMPMYKEISGRLAEFGIPVFCHMDGDLKPLWDLIGSSGLKGIDSFSPPPDNDNPVADAVRSWPEMRLLVNFPSSVHLAPPEKVRQVTREILEQGGHTGRLQIQLSENVPANVWRTSLPVIVEEIRKFKI